MVSAPHRGRKTLDALVSGSRVRSQLFPPVHLLQIDNCNWPEDRTVWRELVNEQRKIDILGQQWTTFYTQYSTPSGIKEIRNCMKGYVFASMLTVIALYCNLIICLFIKLQSSWGLGPCPIHFCVHGSISIPSLRMSTEPSVAPAKGHFPLSATILHLPHPPKNQREKYQDALGERQYGLLQCAPNWDLCTP